MAHEYRLTVAWHDDRGTVDYRSYTRDHVVSAVGKPSLDGSSDRAFRGDPARWNPEELLVAALSQCHLLSFLHAAADAGVVVTAYTDHPAGRMTKDDDGGWSFASVVLHPEVTVAGAAADLGPLHHRAHEDCFIARSVAFPVTVEPVVQER
ncbi:MAG TPA: OsmC family protein [Actinomycetospora sp.]|jgi:organic hydroperoxide reductase OsmC/OhrA|uniref:OsmC family protein n=1 Tax=Actinomycetospora sp. TaxID=1872135 RepID=UPI002F3EFDB4